jgi:membrane fusion protein, multidrug efflux system
MSTEESKPATTEQSGIPEASSRPATPPARKRRSRIVILLVLLVVAILFVAVPRVLHALNTASTDDAYVNGYVTFVAPRVAGM